MPRGKRRGEGGVRMTTLGVDLYITSDAIIIVNTIPVF